MALSNDTEQPVYKSFRRRIFLLLVVLQALLLSISIIVLFSFGMNFSQSSYILLSILSGLSFVAFVITAHYVAQPVKDIEKFAHSMITSVATDSLPEPPANPKNNVVGKEMYQTMQLIYDITEKSQRQKLNMNSQGQLMQALINALPVGFLVFNRKTEVTTINDQAMKILGINQTTDKLSDLILQRIGSLNTDEGPLNFQQWLEGIKNSSIKSTKRWPNAHSKVGDEAITFDFLAHYSKYDSHDYELVIMMIDKSEEYSRQEKQMEFISLAAHELRGPITVMRGLIDVLQHELPTPSQDTIDLLTRMAVSGRQLAGYVDNILNVSRIDQETFGVHVVEGDWLQLLKANLQDLVVRASAHHRKLEVNLPKEPLPPVAVDPSAIQHVINNLVDNAIKYSKEGGRVIVAVKVKDATTIETTVEDFGVGIPASVVEGLFTKFYRSHKSKQIVVGTGLGLYLCKAIVEAHGGNIWVRSTEGAGTTFGFTLQTYASVAEELKKGNNKEGIIRGSHGWIKNHALYRR